MQSFQVWAQPWWVNLLVLIPFITYFAFRRTGFRLSWRQLIIIAIFATAFGFVEAAVVVYLRAATGLLPGYTETLSELQHSSEGYHQEESISQFPQSGDAGGVQDKRPMGGIPLGFCPVGRRLLHRPLGHGAMARFTYGS
jgi:hypothetical protein